MIETAEALIAANVQHTQEQGLGSTGSFKTHRPRGRVSLRAQVTLQQRGFERCGPPMRGFLSMDPLSLNLCVYGPLALRIQARDEGRLE